LGGISYDNSCLDSVPQTELLPERPEVPRAVM